MIKKQLNKDSEDGNDIGMETMSDNESNLSDEGSPKNNKKRKLTDNSKSLPDSFKKDNED